MQERLKHSIIDAAGMERTLTRMAVQILEQNKGTDNLAFQSQIVFQKSSLFWKKGKQLNSEFLISPFIVMTT